jgi:YHS domain-containing protein
MPLLLLLLALHQDKPVEYATTREAMQKVQLIVGEWRCTGMPREMKREAWTEKAGWSFVIEKDLYRIRLSATDAVFWKEATLGYDLKRKVFTLEATAPDGTARAYAGLLKEKDRLLTLEEVTDAWPRERAVFSLLRDNRFLIDFESQSAKGRDWTTLVQIGCTKEGVPFVRGEGPKCIVTGGAGSIAVTYKGKTYYVCCTGCRAFFNEDPDKTIAEAKKQGWIKD